MPKLELDFLAAAFPCLYASFAYFSSSLLLVFFLFLNFCSRGRGLVCLGLEQPSNQRRTPRSGRSGPKGNDLWQMLGSLCKVYFIVNTEILLVRRLRCVADPQSPDPYL